MEEITKHDKTRIFIPKLNMKSVKINFDNAGYNVFNRSNSKTTCNVTAKTLRSNNSKTLLHSRNMSIDENGQKSKNK
jgi:hypothetical protein